MNIEIGVPNKTLDQLWRWLSGWRAGQIHFITKFIHYLFYALYSRVDKKKDCWPSSIHNSVTCEWCHRPCDNVSVASIVNLIRTITWRKAYPVNNKPQIHNWISVIEMTSSKLAENFSFKNHSWIVELKAFMLSISHNMKPVKFCAVSIYPASS